MKATKIRAKKIQQPTGITDIKKMPLYERGGEIVKGKSLGFRGVMTIDGRFIDWKDLFYSKKDAQLKQKHR